MALLLWLPLNGNIDNQGLLNVQTSILGTVTYESGKLGNAAKIGNGSQVINGISINSNLTSIIDDKYSCAVWIKPMGDHVHYEGAIISSGNWNQKKWAFGVNQTNTAVDVFCGGYNYNINCTIPVGEWTHLVSTCDGVSFHLYKNGEYVGSKTYSNYIQLQSDATNTTIGRETYASGYFSFNGYIEDVRVYDHCLSTREIKQLSQGLVLHYPLSQPFGNNNLLNVGIENSKWYLWSNGSSFNDATGNIREKVTDSNGKVWAHVKQVPQSGYGGYTCGPSDNGIVIDPTKKYTISALARAGTSTNAKLVFWNHWRSTEGGANLYQNQTFCDLTSTPKRVYAVWTPNAGSSSYTVDRINLMIGTCNCANNEVYFTDIKFEEGEVATPWIPNQLDPIFNQMNLPISGNNSNLLSESIYGINHWTHTNSNYTKVEQNGAKNTYICVNSISGVWENVYSPAITVTSGKTYTLSCSYRVRTAFSLRSASDNFGLCVQKAVPTNANPSGNTIATISFGNAVTEYMYGSVTFTPSVNTIYLNIPGGYIADGQYNKVVDIDYIKLEEGSVATPWNPNANIEYDVSGYQHNGTKINNQLIEYSVNTPKHQTGAIFKRSSSGNNLANVGYIKTENYYIPDEFTISYWWYYDSDLKIIANPPSSFCYGTLASSGYLNDGIHDYDGHITTNFASFGSDTKAFNNSINIAYPNKTWTHLCITFDGFTMKFYKNGVLYSNASTGQSSKMHVVRSSGVLAIGVDYAGGVVRGASGNISDFRIYATALTADDVLELYNQGKSEGTT